MADTPKPEHDAFEEFMGSIGGSPGRFPVPGRRFYLRVVKALAASRPEAFRLLVGRGVVASLEILSRDALHVRGDIPDVTERIGNTAPAVAVFAVLYRH